jgi:hypothetical protein
MTGAGVFGLALWFGLGVSLAGAWQVDAAEGASAAGQAKTTAVASATAQAGGVPRLFASDGRDLAAFREKLKAGDAWAGKMRDSIAADGEKAMTAGPFTVVKKEFMPPSGDKHDYMSLSPYWWADPSKPDGKPYIRRDGQFNPERSKYDLGPLEEMSTRVNELAMAYYLTGDEKYAERAVLLIRTWFIDPATRMNPNLRFAQSVPGYTEERPSGIIEGGRFRRVVDAIGMIEASAAWTQADQVAMRQWFAELTQYITTAKQGMMELAQPNNHASWATVQVAIYLLFSGQDEKAREILKSNFSRLIDVQIKPDGSQPEELARTLSFHYSRFNLLALMEIAALGDRVGLDLWNYTTADGRGIRLALDYLTPYAVKEKPWPYPQISPMKFGDLVQLYRRAANAYREPAYEEAARRIREEDRRESVDMLFPSKLK